MASISVTVQAPGAQEAARDMRAFADATRQAAMAEDAHVARLKSSEERLANFERVTRRLADAQKQASAQTAAALREETRARFDAFRAIEQEEAARLKAFSGSGGAGGGGGGGNGGGSFASGAGNTHLLRTALGRAAPGLGGLASFGMVAVGVGAAVLAFRRIAATAEMEQQEAVATLQARRELRDAIKQATLAARAASGGQLSQEFSSLMFAGSFGKEGSRGLIDKLSYRYTGAAKAVAATAGLGKQQDAALEAAKLIASTSGIGLDEAVGAITRNGYLIGAGGDKYQIAALGLSALHPGMQFTAGDVANGERRAFTAAQLQRGGDAADTNFGGLRTYDYQNAQARQQRIRRGGYNGAISGMEADNRAEADPTSAVLAEFGKAQREKIDALQEALVHSSALVELWHKVSSAEGTILDKIERETKRGRDVASGR